MDDQSQPPQYPFPYPYSLSGNMYQSQWAPGMLNPALPAFQPAVGSEVQRYAPRTTPVPEIADIQKWMKEGHASQALDMARLQQQHTELKAMFQRDLRYLEAKVVALTESDEEPSPRAPLAMVPIQEAGKYLESCRPEAISEECLSFASEHDRAEARCQERASEHHEDEEAYLMLASEHHNKAEQLRRHAQKCFGQKVLLPAPIEESEAPAEPKPTEVEKEVKEDGADLAGLLERLKTAEAEKSSWSEKKSPQDPWIPHAVREMPKVDRRIPVESHVDTFEYEMLINALNCHEWSDGFYYITNDGPIKLECKAIWLLDEDHDPFIPRVPGENGAKLTALFNESPGGPLPENYLNVPVFVKDGASTYKYYGNYSQLRFSDKVSFDEIVDRLPPKVLEYWASELSAVGRPQWVTDVLIEHFWPKPKYEGRIATDSAINTPATTMTADGSGTGLERSVLNDLEAYAEDLKQWAKDVQFKGKMLSYENILAAFKNADLDLEPGLRLWWEYFECVDYDEGFYNMLVKMKKQPRLVKTSKAGAKRPPTPPIRDSNETEIKQGYGTSMTSKPKRMTKEELTQAEIEAKKPTVFVKPAVSQPTSSNKATIGTKKIGEPIFVKAAVLSTSNKASIGIQKGGEPDKKGNGAGKTVPPHLRGKK